MNEKEFVDQLPSVTDCPRCKTTVLAPVWRVSSFETDWLALNIVACHSCLDVIVASAGSSLDAKKEADRMRRTLLEKAIMEDQKR